MTVNEYQVISGHSRFCVSGHHHFEKLPNGKYTFGISCSNWQRKS